MLRLLRLVVPWALIGVLLLSSVLPGPFFAILTGVQVALYLLALRGLTSAGGRHARLTNTAAAFVLLNGAAWVA